MRRLELGLGAAYAASPSSSASLPLRHVRLNWRPNQGGHKPNSETVKLLQEVGAENISRFTELFYQRAFQDPHIDKFIRDHKGPHGKRFASWIIEKFGGGDVWSAERESRKTCPFISHGHRFQTPHDRSSAHFADRKSVV